MPKFLVFLVLSIGEFLLSKNRKHEMKKKLSMVLLSICVLREKVVHAQSLEIRPEKETFSNGLLSISRLSDFSDYSEIAKYLRVSVASEKEEVFLDQKLFGWKTELRLVENQGKYGIVSDSFVGGFFSPAHNRFSTSHFIVKFDVEKFCYSQAIFFKTLDNQVFSVLGSPEVVGFRHLIMGENTKHITATFDKQKCMVSINFSQNTERKLD